MNYLNKEALTYFWNKIKSYVDSKSTSGTSKVLWTNSSPTSSFSPKTVSWSTHNYSWYRIRIKNATDNAYYYTYDIKVGDSFHLETTGSYTPSGLGYLGLRCRNYCSCTRTSMYFGECKTLITNFEEGKAVGVDNTHLIPVEIIGYNL